MLAAFYGWFSSKEVLYHEQNLSILSPTDPDWVSLRRGYPLSDSLLDLYQVERPKKLDVKTNGSSLEIGFDWKCGSSRSGPGPRALVGQKDYLPAIGKFFALMSKPRRSVELFCICGRKMSKGGITSLPDCRLSAIWFVGRSRQCSFFRRLSKFSPWFT